MCFKLLVLHVLGSVMEVFHDNEGIFTGLFFQDAHMRRVYNAFPELLMGDATYKLTDLRMPLFLKLGIDMPLFLMLGIDMPLFLMLCIDMPLFLMLGIDNPLFTDGNGHSQVVADYLTSEETAAALTHMLEVCWLVCAN